MTVLGNYAEWVLSRIVPGKRAFRRVSQGTTCIGPEPLPILMAQAAILPERFDGPGLEVCILDEVGCSSLAKLALADFIFIALSFGQSTGFPENRTTAL
jgi:hypothetical protein